MSKIKLDARDFEKHVEAYEAGMTEVSELKYETDCSALRLNSTDRLIECIDLFNQSLVSLSALMEKDVFMLKNFKATWMGVDSSLADKTFDEWFTDTIHAIAGNKELK